MSYSTKLAKTILQIYQQEIPLNRAFVDLFSSCEQEIRRLVRKWGLGKVVDNQQIENTALSFLEDLSSSPDESHFVAQIIKICLLQEEDRVKQLQFYVSRRLFTLLKKNAGQNSREYFRFSESVKRSLTILVEKQKILSSKSFYFSVETQATASELPWQSFNKKVLQSLPLKRILVKKSGKILNQELQLSINMLVNSFPHNQHKIHKNSITAGLFNLQNYNSISLQEFVSDNFCDTSQGLLFCRENFVQTFTEQCKSQFSLKDQYLIFMLSLGWLGAIHKEYFSENDFLPGHAEIFHTNLGVIDKVHNFLNNLYDEDLILISIGRTTVYNRLKIVKSVLAGMLCDITIEQARQEIRELITFLLEQYRCNAKGGLL